MQKNPSGLLSAWEHPPAIRTRLWHGHWRVSPMQDDGGRPLAEDGAQVITDPTAEPVLNSILLQRTPSGLKLKRFGGLVGEHALWASLDLGKDPELVPNTQLAEAEVVVGILLR